MVGLLLVLELVRCRLPLSLCSLLGLCSRVGDFEFVFMGVSGLSAQPLSEEGTSHPKKTAAIVASKRWMN